MIWNLIYALRYLPTFVTYAKILADVLDHVQWFYGTSQTLLQQTFHLLECWCCTSRCQCLALQLSSAISSGISMSCTWFVLSSRKTILRHWDFWNTSEKATDFVYCNKVTFLAISNVVLISIIFPQISILLGSTMWYSLVLSSLKYCFRKSTIFSVL